MFRSHNLGVGLTSFGVIASLAILCRPPPAAAQSTWTGLINNTWNNGNNWSAGGIPDSPTATATFAGQGLGTINIVANVSAVFLGFSNPTGNYTLTSSAGVSLNDVTAIDLGPDVTGVQTINLANIAAGSLLFKNGYFLSIQNFSTAAGTTLVIGPNTVIGTAGNGGVIVSGTGTTQISGSFAASPNNVIGGLGMNGTGTLILSNPTNQYTGGTIVYRGTLAVGANGAVIPAGTAVTVLSGATFDLGPYTNVRANALSGVTLTGGTLRATGATNSDFYTQQFTMTGGTVDFTNTPFTWIHVTGSAGITTNAAATTATWIGAGTSRFLNDYPGGALPLTVAAGTTPSGIDLDAGIMLGINGANSTFNKLGPGTVRLTNPLNTASFVVSQGVLRVDDMAALGSGAITLAGAPLVAGFLDTTARLQYSGTSASSDKNLTLDSSGGSIGVSSPSTTLTLTGSIIEIGGTGRALTVYGDGSGGSAVLALSGSNNYTGPTLVEYLGVLSIGSIANGGVNSPIGASSSAPVNLQLGNGSSFGSGTLRYTGATASTDRGLKLGVFGGTVDVTSAATNLTFSGQFTGFANLYKTGPGTLTLSNATNNVPEILVQGGRLALGSATAIPIGGNVTVYAGATFDTGGFGNTAATAIGTVIFEDGGTLRAAPTTPGTYYYLNRLYAFSNGGIVDATGAAGNMGLAFVNAGAAIAIAGNSTWTGPNTAFAGNAAGTEIPITITPNVTLTSDFSLAAIAFPLASYPFRVTGGGTLYLTNPAAYGAVVRVNQARLRMDDLTNVNPGHFELTLDAGTLAYGGPTASSPAQFALGAGGGTVEVVNAATTLTLTSYISGIAFTGTAALTKAGPGTLVLTYPYNTYIGGITVSGGRLDVGSDAQLGAANPTVNPAGTLRYTASTTTARTFNLNGGTLEAPTGVTLTMDGAAVNGGFLRGAGTFALTGNTALSGSSTATSTTVNQTGLAAVTNFTNNGQFTTAAGQTLTWSNGTNTSAGRLIVNGIANASDFVSNGGVTVNGGGAINNSGSNLVLGGGSRTTINPSGTLAAAAGTSIELNGGLLVNNGTITGTTDVNNGSVVRGTGVYGIVNVNQGGIYAPGNSPGISTAAAVTFDHTSVGSGAPVLEIELAGIVLGTQYDQLHVTGQLSLGGTLQVSLIDGFNPALGNTFDILDWTTRSGTFSSIQLQTLSSTLAWSTYRLYTAGELSVVDINLQPGDFNRDLQVSAADIPVMLEALTNIPGYQTQYNVSDSDLLAIGDFDNSGSFTNADMQGLLYLLSQGRGGSAAAVPEPATALLLLLGFVIVGFLRSGFQHCPYGTVLLSGGSWSSVFCVHRRSSRRSGIHKFEGTSTLRRRIQKVAIIALRSVLAMARPTPSPAALSVRLIVALAVLAVAGRTARAENLSWSGGATGNWYDSTNWTGGRAGLVPSIQDGAIFQLPASGNVTVSLGFSANRGYQYVGFLDFQEAHAYTFQGGVAGGAGAFNILNLTGDGAGGGGITVEQFSGAVTIGTATGGVQVNVAGSQFIQNDSSLTFNNGIAGVSTGTNILFFSAVPGGGPTGTTTLNGSITDATTESQPGSVVAVVVMNGTGRLQFSGPNGYSGGTTVNGGTLFLGHDNGLGTATQTLRINGGTLAATGAARTVPAAISVVVGGDFALGGQGQAITFNGTVDLGGATCSITVNSDATFAGAVSHGGITKLGTSTLTLAGTNTYTGGTTVNGGALAVNGSIQGNATVNSGATLQGIGSIGGLVTVNSGGKLAPGNSPGTLIVGSLVLNAGSQTAIELGGTTRGTGANNFDAIISNSAISLNGTLQVSLINGFNPALGNTFDILDWTTRSGTFSSIQLPTIAPALAWSTYRLYTAGELSVVDINLQPGDFNRDLQVTAADIPVMLEALTNIPGYQLQYSVSDSDLLAIGDFDNSGSFTNADMQGLLYLLSHGGIVLGSPSPAAPVPEPTSISLLLMGAIAGLVINRASRRGASRRLFGSG